jgi:DNA-binding response OmpR family regulator
VGERVQALREDTRVLYVSGRVGESFRDGTRPFLPKPFTPEVLLARVRDLLGGA